MTRRTAVLDLTLSHFRSWKRGRIDTGGAPVALHGPNGAGKTNVLEAVSLLAPGRGLRRAPAPEMARKPDEIGWRVAAVVSTPSGEIEIDTRFTPGDSGRGVQIDGKTATQTALGGHVRTVWLTPAMDRLWTEAASDRRRFLDRMVLGFDAHHGDTSIAYEKAMRQRNRLLSEPPWDQNWLDSLEAQLARLGARIARGRAEALAALREAQDTAETSFPRADLAIAGDFAPEIDLDEPDMAETGLAVDLARALAEGRPRDAAAGRTLTGPHRSDLSAIYAAKAMPAAACSTGEQKALLISLCLANARALAGRTGAAPVLLFDEVAAHLDAARRAALYAEIAALGAQAWMTGTGPELFDALGADALRLAVTEEGGVSSLDPT